MADRPGLLTILPYMILPFLLAVLLGIFARRRGASWVQLQVSLGAGLLGAFMTASGWVFSAYLNGHSLSLIKTVGSQVLVGLICALAAFFSTMPVEQDLTQQLRRAQRTPENANEEEK